MKKYPNPNTPLKIAVLFLVIDFFALQKPLSGFTAWLLVVTPLTLLATTCFLWAYHKQFPFLRSPIWPYIDFSDERSNVFHALLSGFLFTFLAIIFTIQFFNQ